MYENPYRIDRHRQADAKREACPCLDTPMRYYEERDGAYQPIDNELVQANECSACNYQWKITAEYIRYNADPQTGITADPRELDTAYRAMEYEAYFDTFAAHIPPSDVSVTEYEWIVIVRSERARLKGEQDHNAWLKSKEAK